MCRCTGIEYLSDQLAVGVLRAAKALVSLHIYAKLPETLLFAHKVWLLKKSRIKILTFAGYVRMGVLAIKIENTR